MASPIIIRPVDHENVELSHASGSEPFKRASECLWKSLKGSFPGPWQRSALLWQFKLLAEIFDIDWAGQCSPSPETHEVDLWLCERFEAVQLLSIPMLAFIDTFISCLGNQRNEKARASWTIALDYVHKAVLGRFWDLHGSMLECDDLQLRGPNKAIYLHSEGQEDLRRRYEEEKCSGLCLEAFWVTGKLSGLAANKLRVGDVLGLSLLENRASQSTSLSG